MDTHSVTWRPERITRSRLAQFGLLSLVATAPAFAAHLELQLDGVEGPLRDAALAGAELNQYATRDVTAAQAHRLYERAPSRSPPRSNRTATTTPRSAAT